MDPKSRKAIFVGYNRLTDKIYCVFDPMKKIVERVSDIIIQDTVDKDNQVLFSIPPDNQEEIIEEPFIESSTSRNDEDKIIGSDDDSEQTIDDANEESLSKEKNKRE